LYRLPTTVCRQPAPPSGAGNNELYLTARGISNFDGEKDLAGSPRLFGTNIDLGAYEPGAYLATFRFGPSRPDSIAGVAFPYVLTEPSPAPGSTGYTLDEWYADAALTIPFDFTGNLTQDSTLHAKWALILSPALKVCGQPLPPVEGAGTKDDPFTAAVVLPVNTAKLMPTDIHTGNASDVVTFYANSDYTLPVSGLDLYPGETVQVYLAVQVGNMTFYYALGVTRSSEEVMPTVRRNVTLPPVDGAVIDPPAGIHQVAPRHCGLDPQPPIQPVHTPPTAQTLTGFETLSGLLAIAMPLPAACFCSSENPNTTEHGVFNTNNPQ
jgi:hypothetical protein